MRIYLIAPGLSKSFFMGITAETRFVVSDEAKFPSLRVLMFLFIFFKKDIKKEEMPFGGISSFILTLFQAFTESEFILCSEQILQFHEKLT